MDGPDLSIERPSKMERRGEVGEEPAATTTSPKNKLKKKKVIEKLSNGNFSSNGRWLSFTGKLSFQALGPCVLEIDPFSEVAVIVQIGQIYSNSQICLPWLKDSW